MHLCFLFLKRSIEEKNEFPFSRLICLTGVFCAANININIGKKNNDELLSGELGLWECFYITVNIVIIL